MQYYLHKPPQCFKPVLLLPHTIFLTSYLKHIIQILVFIFFREISFNISSHQNIDVLWIQ